MAFTPLDPTKAEVRTLQNGTQLEFDFYIPRGAKGEPGGWAAATDLGITNLDDIKVPGLYRQSNPAVATALLNYPSASSASLEVLQGQGPSEIFQRFTPWGGANAIGRVLFIRRWSASGWTTWTSHASTRVDQSAGRAVYQWDSLNNRDQLIYGDTGWRNVDADAGWTSALFTAGSVTQSPGYPVRVRRIGYNVEVHYAIDKAAAGPVTSAAAIPLGFRPVSGTSVQAVGANSGLAMFRVFHAGGVSNVIHQSPAAISGASTTLIYSTADAWPTTLPGSAVGTIPNL